MKTALVTTCWLDNSDYMMKTKKWLEYYIYPGNVSYDNIILLDNASKFESIHKIQKDYNILTQRFTKHYTRESHLSYKYLWRKVFFFQELFKEYDKIVYMDNDGYLISDNIIDFVNRINSGWHTFWCSKHNFNETGIQVICKDSEEYKKFIEGHTEESFIEMYNGKTMETTLPIPNVHKQFNGDRWSEHGITVQQDGWDFSTQTPLDMDIEYE